MACAIPARYVFTLMGFLCFTMQYMLRTSLSITIVAMVNSSSSEPSYNISNDCNQNFVDPDTSQKQGEFDWDEGLQGIILSAFFWGYIIPMLLSGWLSSRYGGKILFIAGLGVDGIFSLCIPIAARTHVGLLIACRVIMGVAEGVMVPSFHHMLGKWAPLDERSRMSSFSYAGQSFGIVLVLPLAGLVCQYGFDGGWPTVFYTLGVTALLCCCFYLFLVYDSPAVHPRISKEEREYIQISIGVVENKAKFLPVPWKNIMKSFPVWALSIISFGFSWGHYTLLTQLPNYMKNILGFDIKTNGFYSSLPYLLYFINCHIYGITGDFLIKRKILSVTNTRKTFQFISTGLPALCLIAITFFGCNKTLIITCLVLAGGFFSSVYTASGVNHVDLSPNFSGMLQGVTLTIGNLAGLFVPFVIGLIVQGQQTRSQWNLVFYLSASILMISTIIYCLFGSGKLQSWNSSDNAESVQISQEITKKEISNNVI